MPPACKLEEQSGDDFEDLNRILNVPSSHNRCSTSCGFLGHQVLEGREGGGYVAKHLEVIVLLVEQSCFGGGKFLETELTECG